MTLVTNTFEGGSDGTTVTTGNSGGASGTAFNDVVKAADGTVAFSNVQKRGTLACRFQQVTAGDCHVAWNETTKGALTDDYVRAYMYLTNAFTLNNDQIEWWSAAFGFMGSIRWTSTGAFTIANASASPVATSATTVGAGEWCRIEAHKHADTSAGFITCRIFKGADLEGTTPTEEFGTSSTWADPATSSTWDYFGMPTAIGSQPPSSGFLYMDDIAAGGTDWLGPTITDPGLALREPRLTFGPF